jgi:hypothetical protein
MMMLMTRYKFYSITFCIIISTLSIFVMAILVMVVVIVVVVVVVLMVLLLLVSSCKVYSFSTKNKEFASGVRCCCVLPPQICI